jgi:hypothetical protein
MKRIEPKVVKTLSIVDQIIEAPVDTVVIVKYPDDFGGDPKRADALVKTGSNGYQAARYARSNSYLHHGDLDRWFKSFPSDSEFYFV